MISRAVFAAFLLLSSAAFAQGLDPLRNVSGTTAGVGNNGPWVTSGSGGWTFFHGFDAHLTYLTQTGPEVQETDTFSTNWFAAGLHRNVGDRAFVLVRGRVSLEPYTIDENGYAQFFQYITAEHGGQALQDRMRPHDLFGEAAVQVGYRPTAGTLVSVYGALVGQPALGAPPAQLRASGVDFAEAPFTWDITETTHDSTSVVTAGFSTRWLSIEASAFHDAVTTGDHTELDTGGIDSQSARLTLMPSNNLAVQISRGSLGEDDRERDVTSASLTYGGGAAAVTALWTQREYAEDVAREAETAWGLEVALRGGRNTFMARVEHVDRPAGFPFIPVPQTGDVEEATHYTAGYIFDFLTSRYRAGVGVNIDYRTQTHDYEHVYGHKPQGIYAFIRLRTAM